MKKTKTRTNRPPRKIRRIVLYLLLCIILLIGTHFLFRRAAMNRALTNNLEDIRISVEEQANTILRQLMEQARLPEFDPLNEPHTRDTLSQLSAPEYTSGGYYAFRTDGYPTFQRDDRVIAITDLPTGEFRPDFLYMSKGRTFSHPYTRGSDGITVISVYKKLNNHWCLGIDIPLTEFAKLFSSVTVGPQICGLIDNSTQTIIFYPDFSQLGLPLGKSQDPLLQTGLSMTRSNTRRNEAGQKYICQTTYTNNGWTLLLCQTPEVLLKDFNKDGHHYHNVYTSIVFESIPLLLLEAILLILIGFAIFLPNRTRKGGVPYDRFP